MRIRSASNAQCTTCTSPFFEVPQHAQHSSLPTHKTDTHVSKVNSTHIHIHNNITHTHIAPHILYTAHHTRSHVWLCVSCYFLHIPLLLTKAQHKSQQCERSPLTIFNLKQLSQQHPSQLQKWFDYQIHDRSSNQIHMMARASSPVLCTKQVSSLSSKEIFFLLYVSICAL